MSTQLPLEENFNPMFPPPHMSVRTMIPNRANGKIILCMTRQYALVVATAPHPKDPVGRFPARRFPPGPGGLALAVCNWLTKRWWCARTRHDEPLPWEWLHLDSAWEKGETQNSLEIFISEHFVSAFLISPHFSIKKMSETFIAGKLPSTDFCFFTLTSSVPGLE